MSHKMWAVQEDELMISALHVFHESPVTNVMHVQSVFLILFSVFHQMTCEANSVGENSSFSFTVCVKSVPRYHFELAYVVLQMAIQQFLVFIFRVISADLEMLSNMKSTCWIFIHTWHLLLNMNTGHIFRSYKHS